MHIDDFGLNLSFFFRRAGSRIHSHGTGGAADLGHGAALQVRGSASAVKLKSSTLADVRQVAPCAEAILNDIRTTLQALLAIYDNTNSLHTNAYDEAITTPTAESVRSGDPTHHQP